MAGFTFVVDDTSWDATNTAFTINDNTTRFLLGCTFPLPEPEVLYAQPVDADGGIPAHMRYLDRQGCNITFAIQGSSASNLETTLGQWSQKLGKLNASGGTLKATTPAGTSFFLIIRPGSHGANFDRRYVKVNRAEVSWTFPAWSFWIGTAVQQSDTVETTLPYVSKTATGPAGDVPVRGQLLIDEDQAIDQWWVVWGIEDSSQYDITAATGALFFEAESRTAFGGSAIAVGPSGASGAGSNVMRNTALANIYQAILSTQATGGGAHLTHVGTFRVYARVQPPTSNAGTVSIALAWSAGDFLKVVENASVDLDPTWEGTWRLVDLGLVSIPKVLSGSQRWEGRVLAKSTVPGDDIDVDYLLLIPASIRSGIASAVRPTSTPPVSLSAADDLTPAGALTGTAPDVGGGTWAGAGSATDFTTSGGAFGRTAVSDAAAITGGRFCTIGSSIANTTVGVECKTSAAGVTGGVGYPEMGVLARFTNTSNFASLLVRPNASGSQELAFYKRVAGTLTLIKAISISTRFTLDTFLVPTLVIDARGRWWAFLNDTLLMTDQDAVFATAGTLATGTAGIYDGNATVTAATRGYRNFRSWSQSSDSAVFASQSLEIRYDGVVREDSAGAIWSPVSAYEGDLLRVPAGGREARNVRWIVKACRNDPVTGPDAGIDDISARLTQTPLYLTVPSP